MTLIRWLTAVCVVMVTGCAPAHAPQPPSPLHYAYMPVVKMAPTPTPQPCLQSPQAREFARLLIGDSRQQRTTIRCNPALVRAAQHRAESMATLGYFGHCDPNGVCPNPVARAAGCRLPSYYSLNGNNVESILAGASDPALVWKLLSASPSHAVHLLGTSDFFREQQDIGVAFVDVPGSRYTYYWVVMIAVCEASSGE